MSVNDSSRIFHPSAAQASPAAAAGPVQTSTTSAPPPTINTTSAPPTLPPRAAASPTTTTSPTHQAHPVTTAGASALPTSPSSATHSTLSGGRDPSRVSSQSERSGRSLVVQDGLYPISAFVLKQGVSLDHLPLRPRSQARRVVHVPRVFLGPDSSFSCFLPREPTKLVSSKRRFFLWSSAVLETDR